MPAPVAPDLVTVFITHLGMECREDTGFDHAGDVACQVKLVRCVESGQARSVPKARLSALDARGRNRSRRDLRNPRCNPRVTGWIRVETAKGAAPKDGPASGGRRITPSAVGANIEAVQPHRLGYRIIIRVDDDNARYYFFAQGPCSSGRLSPVLSEVKPTTPGSLSEAKT